MQLTRPSLKQIDQVVIEFVGNTHGQSNAEKHVRPRQIAMYLMRQHAYSLPEISRQFLRARMGGLKEPMCHTTVLSSVRKIEDLLREPESDEANQLRMLIDELGIKIAALEPEASTRFRTVRPYRPQILQNELHLRRIIREELEAVLRMPPIGEPSPVAANTAVGDAA